LKNRRTNTATEARRLALNIISAMRSRSAFVNPLIERSMIDSKLSYSDRAFVVQLARGVAATSGELDIIIKRACRRGTLPEPRVHDILRLATYELVYLHKEPFIPIHQAVELAREQASYAAPFVNAVLRQLVRELEEFPWGDPKTSVEAAAHLYAFPQWLAQRLVSDLGDAAARSFMEASNQPAPVYFANMLDLSCVLIDSRELPRYKTRVDAGELIVADASTQEVARIALPLPDGSFLEVGSGRGTKTILIQRAAVLAYGRQTRQYALEKAASKQMRFEARLRQYGLEPPVSIRADVLNLGEIIAAGKLPRSYRGALIDAPCSNTGTLRRHPEARWRLTSEAVTQMAEQGLAMLRVVAPHIEKDGFVVYSTCSVLVEENEQVVEAFLASEAGRGFSRPEPFFRPMLTPGSPDAHFAAKLIRDEQKEK
jgi:16S rRNA (cytosine967-C5)-methyltransferase